MALEDVIYIVVIDHKICLHALKKIDREGPGDVYVEYFRVYIPKRCIIAHVTYTVSVCYDVWLGTAGCWYVVVL